MSELTIEMPGLFNGHSSLSFRKATDHTSRKACECCPYGYHIDLGFVEFCDRLSKKNAQPSAKKIERRERRLRRQSMDVLLGVTNPQYLNTQEVGPVYSNDGGLLESGDAPVPPIRTSSYIYDSEGLKKAVQDFEATLQRTTKLHPQNASTVHESMAMPADLVKATPTTDVTIAASGSTPLQSIRAQMALSLEKMKELEDQVKIVPWLNVQITELEQEKSKLLQQVSELTLLLSLKQEEEKRESAKKPKVQEKVSNREKGVLCVPKTREVGTSVPTPNKRSTSTETEKCQMMDESSQTIVIHEERPVEEAMSISLKDLDNFEKHDPKKPDGTEPTIVAVVLKSPVKMDSSVQTEPVKKITRDLGMLAKPQMVNIAVEKKPAMREVGVSDCTISQLLCDKCKNVQTRSVGVGLCAVKDPIPIPGDGLANRSKSFDFSRRKDTRSIGVSTIPPVKKLTATKQVGTTELAVLKVHSSVNTDPVLKRTVSTTAAIKEECKICKGKEEAVEKCISTPKKVESEMKSKEKVLSLEKNETLKDGHSKIPRPTGNTTPIPNRKKLVRQDTYSKTTPIGSASEEEPRLKLSPEKPEVLVEDQVGVILRKKVGKHAEDKVTEAVGKLCADLSIDEKRASVASTSGTERYSGFYEDGGYDYDENYGDQESNRNSHIFPDNTLFQPIQEKSREKLVPSKEMKAAMKVVNDGLHKSPSGPPKHPKTACGIIQQEWFKISSTATANPLDVEDYLDNFEEVSSALLEFVVNLVDNNGNTAMHYAVSHGNFDVVSILLDSKVCNINKPNAAGYTCIMLVSLAQVRSDTHREVVRRLFQLADVNVRAKQFGQTALMLAVSHGRLDMVQLLLEAGADPNIQDCDGSTALMCAAEHGHLDIVKQILAHPDCDPAIVDCDGSSALAIAMEAGNRDIGVLLYAREHFAPSSRGNSPYAPSRTRKNRASASPNLKAPSPNQAKRSDHHSF